MSLNANIIDWSEATDAAGNNRLRLRIIERLLPTLKPGDKAYDFHSLLWEGRNDGGWFLRIAITQEAFQHDGPRRWVSEIKSLDSAAGTAIIRVGEEKPRDAKGGMQVEYSWREWDLPRNLELRFIRVCANPFEPFE